MMDAGNMTNRIVQEDGISYREVSDENHQQVFQEYKRFMKEKIFTDVTLVCENKKFFCHRVVLASASSYFEKLLNSSMFTAEKNGGLVLIANMRNDIFKAIVEFIYSGTTRVRLEDYEDFIKSVGYLKLNCLAHINPVVNEAPMPSTSKCIQPLKRKRGQRSEFFNDYNGILKNCIVSMH